ncbi:MAG: 16S rRNA (cytosine(1402)-N(4))-methyltransferase RsmH [Patescibacteria group bacterium]
MSLIGHIPVLAKEVLEGLALRPGARVLDGTVGLGGHAILMLDATSPNGELIAFDRDERNLTTATAQCTKFDGRVTFIHDSFGNIASHDVGMFDAALLDLGFSSVHVDDATRGFSFMHDGPLDMRYDTRQELTAGMIVNTWTRDDMTTILRRFGEDPRAPIIAKAIVDARRHMQIEITKQLADIVSSVVPRTGKTHPATKTFQALRIVVNDELGEVERGLGAIVDRLKPGGRVAVLTFHSLEDRAVKVFFKQRDGVRSLTKKPIVASREEVQQNPRSRSAKLRIVEKL